MKKIFGMLLVVAPLFLLASCGGEPPSVGSTDEATKVCPYLVPYCDPSSCKLEGSCPQKCVCPGSHKCGTGTCGANDVCCPGTVNPDGSINYVCEAGDVCTY
jgi:hypothetical protein